MSTLTSRLALTKPAGTDSMATGGSVLSTNYDIIDAAVGTPHYTSATRPASPWVGRVIWETDTGNYRFWDGAKWAYWGNSAKAGIREVGTNGLGSLSVTAETQLEAATFSAVQNRRYRIEYCLYGEHTTNVNGAYRTRLRWAAGATVTTAGTLIREQYVKCNSSGATGMQVMDVAELNYTAASASITVGLFCMDNAADTISIAGSVDGTDIIAVWIIRDIGAS